MTIGIIAAMEGEVAVLRDKIVNREDKTIGGIEFYHGTLEGKEVVLSLSGIGKVNAAIAASILIQEFSPRCILNTGCAGGTKEGCHVGDIVISSDVTHHDVDLTVFGYSIGQTAGGPKTYIADDNLVQLAKTVIGSIDNVNAHIGLIASGDAFMSDPSKINDVKTNFDGILAVEMEAAGVAQTCNKFETPFVVVRSLSDIAGIESVDYAEFLPLAEKNSSHFVCEILKKL